MSFIKIENEEKNIYKFLNQLRDDELNVVVSKNILSQTNDFHVIKAMLNKINKLDVDEKKKYKDVVISMFDRRIQRDSEKEIGLNIAKECGFIKELNEVIEYTDGIGYQSKAGASEKVLVIDNWLNSYDNICGYDVVMVVGEVERFRCSNKLEGVVDLRELKNADFTFCDLSKVKDFKFSEKNAVNMQRAILPQCLDVSQCGHIYIGWNTDISNVKMIKFRDEYQMQCADLDTDWDSEGKISFVFDDVQNVETVKKEENEVIDEVKSDVDAKPLEASEQSILGKIKSRLLGR
ncbi:MAG: hypothetical protein IJZ30_03965 [Alphaproteobacteria bacterium]|nr:hypothetical protein [Alphaproteobacteria bacterium]